MNKPLRLLASAAFAGAAILFSSCANVKQESGTAFSFDPPVTQPTNRSAVKIHISTSAGRLYVTEGDKILLATPVGVGANSTPTPEGSFKVTTKTRHRRRQGNPGRGYPMTYWMSFYSPAYGMHWGFVKPDPSTHGCIRMPLNSARKVFDLASVGTPVIVSNSQKWDDTVGAKLPVLDDGPLPNPPQSYMLSEKVFEDQEKGKMWNYN